MSEKGGRIWQTLKETQERRSAMKCSVFRLKYRCFPPLKRKKDYLARLFFAKKWFRNAVIASENLSVFDYKTKTVKVKKQEAFEDREIKVLSSQMHKSVIEEVQGNIKALSTLKKHEKRVRKPKFLSRCNTLALKQAGTTYRIAENRLFVQKFKKPVRLGVSSKVRK